GGALQPRLELLLARQQDWHSLVVDRRHELVARGGQKRVDLQVYSRAVFLHWPLVASPDAGKRERRPRLVAVDGEPMPRRRLYVAVGFTERRCRRQAAPLLKRTSPEARASRHPPW